MRDDLPRIDTHRATCAAPVTVAFDSLWHLLSSSFDGRLATTYARVVRCEPRAVAHSAAPEPGVTTLVGFAVTHVDRPRALTLAGRHHFSRYRIEFQVTPTGAATSQIEATTFADFPGRLGRLYRMLVLGTRIHVLVTRRMLRAASAAGERRG